MNYFKRISMACLLAVVLAISGYSTPAIAGLFDAVDFTITDNNYVTTIGGGTASCGTYQFVSDSRNPFDGKNYIVGVKGFYFTPVKKIRAIVTPVTGDPYYPRTQHVMGTVVPKGQTVNPATLGYFQFRTNGFQMGFTPTDVKGMRSMVAQIDLTVFTQHLGNLKGRMPISQYNQNGRVGVYCADDHKQPIQF